MTGFAASVVGFVAALQQFLGLGFLERLVVVGVADVLLVIALAPILADWTAPERDRSGHEAPNPTSLFLSFVLLVLAALIGVAVATGVIGLSTIRTGVETRSQGAVLSVYAPYQIVERVVVTLPPAVECAPAVPAGANAANGVFETDGQAIHRFVVTNFGMGQGFSLVCPQGTNLTGPRLVVTPATQPVLYAADQQRYTINIWSGGLIACVIGVFWYFWLLRHRRYAP